MAVLGMETSSGDFEVIDLCFAGLPEIYRPPSDAPYLNGKTAKPNGKGKEKASDAMEVDGKSILWPILMPEIPDAQNGTSEKTWVAVVSGLSVGAQEALADIKVQMLVDWLRGESAGPSVSYLQLYFQLDLMI